MRSLPPSVVLENECRHLRALLVDGVLLLRDIDASLERIRAALVAAITVTESARL